MDTTPTQLCFIWVFEHSLDDLYNLFLKPYPAELGYILFRKQSQNPVF